MFGLLRRRASATRLPAEVRDGLDPGDVIVMAEGVRVVARLGGHVPGVYAASNAARFRGAFVVTGTGIVATLPTPQRPDLRAVDARWDTPGGPAHLTIGATGMRVDIALRGVDPAFSGSLTLTYKTDIADEQLRRLPGTRLRCAVDPEVVYRAAGVRPRK